MFIEYLLNHLGKELWQAHGEIICQCCDLGRRKFYAKFAWLFNYEQDIHSYTEIVTQIRSVQIQLKTQGLHSESCQEWLKTISINSFTPKGQKFPDKIIEYLTFEANQIPIDQVLLGTCSFSSIGNTFKVKDICLYFLQLLIHNFILFYFQNENCCIRTYSL